MQYNQRPIKIMILVFLFVFQIIRYYLDYYYYDYSVRAVRPETNKNNNLLYFFVSQINLILFGYDPRVRVYLIITNTPPLYLKWYQIKMEQTVQIFYLILILVRGLFWGKSLNQGLTPHWSMNESWRLLESIHTTLTRAFFFFIFFFTIPETQILCVFLLSAVFKRKTV